MNSPMPLRNPAVLFLLVASSCWSLLSTSAQEPDVSADQMPRIPPKSVEEALKAGADTVLLDNMASETLRRAVAITRGVCKTEASGGVTLENIRDKAETGVDYISVGRITQSAPAVDIGLDWTS